MTGANRLLQAQRISRLAVAYHLADLENAADPQGRLAVGADQTLAKQHVARGAQHIRLALHPGAQGRRAHVINLQADGGDVELVDVSADGVVKVKLTGACHGCPMSQMTLKMGIEKIIKQQVPGIKEVVSV